MTSTGTRVPDTCPAVLAAAQRYLLTKVRTWSPAYVRLVRARSDVQCAEDAMDFCVLAGDTEALRYACRRWWAAVLA